MKLIILLLVTSFVAFAGDSLTCSNETIRAFVTISGPTFQSGIRKRQNITRTVMANMANIRMIYTERLRTGLRFEGKVVLRYGIDSKGRILFPSIDSTDISDTVFIQKLIANVKSWQYDQVSSSFDTSIVQYPFAFEIPDECKDKEINEDDAIRIAVVAWERTFGKRQIDGEKPYLAVLRDSLWYVTGSLPFGTQGSTAKAQISRKSGKVIRIYREE